MRRTFACLARAQKSPIAVSVLEHIGAFLAIECEDNGKFPGCRDTVRQERAAPLITEIKILHIRAAHLNALDRASIDLDIAPFAEYVAERVRWSMRQAAKVSNRVRRREKGA